MYVGSRVRVYLRRRGHVLLHVRRSRSAWMDCSSHVEADDPSRLAEVVLRPPARHQAVAYDARVAASRRLVSLADLLRRIP